MKAFMILMSLLLAATHTWGVCPKAEALATASEPPTVSIEATAKANVFTITVDVPTKPVCLAILELAAQGIAVRHAALLDGPTETPVADAKKSANGMSRFVFNVDSWLPEGRTRYRLWFPAGQWYVALDPHLVLWFRDGTLAQAARIGTQSVGTLMPTKKKQGTLPLTPPVTPASPPKKLLDPTQIPKPTTPP